MKKIRIGLMGFGEIPRHIYRLCLNNDSIEIVAIADIGRPEILHYLLVSESSSEINVRLEGNFLVSKNGKARIMMGGNPGDIPWDIFNLDYVIDGTNKYNNPKEMQKHISAGASRVIITHLPTCTIDRIVIVGVNENTIKSSDKLISAGSATTNATAIILKILDEAFGVECAMLTTVHSYTSDQPLRDRAGTDYRRSRSAAENIIPNDSPSPAWIQKILPEFNGRIEGSALNVPVPHGSLLDLTLVMKDANTGKGDVLKEMNEAAKKYPNAIEVVEDPIVSTDIIGNGHSVIFDSKAIMKSPGKMIKTLSWYHTSFTMASRIIDVIEAYNLVDKKGGVK